MNNNTRRIVVLDKIDSPRIEQAIFILRDDTDTNECDAVSEAQRIVNNYLFTMSGENDFSSTKKNSSKFIFGMAIYTFATVILTTYLLALIK